MQDAVIVAATRTAAGKAPNGSLKTVRPDELAASVIAGKPIGLGTHATLTDLAPAG